MFNNMKKQGFTLVETLVAITILLIAIAGPLTIASKGLNGAYYARDQITAYYLAQEGIEYIRNVRDTNSLSETLDRTHWIDGGFTSGGLSLCVNNYCRINVQQLNPQLGIVDCTTDSNPYSTVSEPLHCEPLMIDTSPQDGSTLYDYNPAGTPSQFTRDIIMTPIDPNADGSTETMQVTSTVYWKSPLPNNSFSLTEDITNWEK